MPDDALHWALAASKAYAALERAFEDRSKGGRGPAFTLHRRFFEERGVRFDAGGHPLLPYGPCGDVDLEFLLEQVTGTVVTFLDDAEEQLGLDLHCDMEVDVLSAVGWRHGFIRSAVGEDRERWLVPLVVGLDLKTGEVLLERRGTRAYVRETEVPNPVLRLFAAQNPKTWQSWVKLQRGGS